MKEMEFDSIFESDMPPESTGLAAPSYTVKIWSNKERIAKLKIGTFDPLNQQYYAQIGEKIGYYLLKKKYLESIPLDLNSFKIK